MQRAFLSEGSRKESTRERATRNILHSTRMIWDSEYFG